MNREEYDAIHAMVEKGECPVCRCHYGRRLPKATVMQHLRTSKDSKHMLWRAKNWKIVFARGKFCPGNHPLDREELIATLRAGIKKAYGEEVYQSVCTA